MIIRSIYVPTYLLIAVTTPKLKLICKYLIFKN